jgi:hypothetical protein
MLVPIDKTTLKPLDPEEERLGHPAVIEDINTDTEIVYSPPYLNLRLFLLLVIMLAVHVLLVYFVYVGPIVYGRYIFKHSLGFKENVYDVYSFLVGGSIVLGSTSFIINVAAGLKGAYLQNSAMGKIQYLCHHYYHFFLYSKFIKAMIK